MPLIDQIVIGAFSILAVTGVVAVVLIEYTDPILIRRRKYRKEKQQKLMKRIADRNHRHKVEQVIRGH